MDHITKASIKKLVKSVTALNKVDNLSRNGSSDGLLKYFQPCDTDEYKAKTKRE